MRDVIPIFPRTGLFNRVLVQKKHKISGMRQMRLHPLGDDGEDISWL